MSIQLDKAAFHRRIGNLVQHWKDDDAAYASAECILIPVGTAGDDSATYQKSISLQDTFYALCSSKKAAILKQLNEHPDKSVTVKSFVRAKDGGDGDAMKAFLAQVAQHKIIGHFSKDKFDGKLVAEWQTAFEPVRIGCELVDVSAAVGTVLAIKDEEELKALTTACTLSSQVLQKYFVEQMATIIDEEKKIAHDKLATRVENSLFDEKIRSKLGLPADVSFEVVEWCYTPIIQSGGNFDLKPSAVSDSNNLHPGAIISSMGTRYRSYCSNVARTYMIDPSKEQENNYMFLLDLQQAIIEQMKDGMACKDLFTLALSYVKDKRPEFEKHLVKNIGFVTGIEFRDGSYVLNSKSTRELKNNMTVSLSVGFQNLPNADAEDAQGKVYSLLLVDTVLVGPNGATVLTTADKKWTAVSFYFKSESDDEENAVKEILPPTRSGKSAILKTKLRHESREEHESNEMKRRAHQAQLLQTRCQDGLERFSGGAGVEAKSARQLFRRFESYKKEALLPREIKNSKILVDRRADSIILPVFGMAVPFHVATLKNISKNEEGEYMYLRMNFNTPGQATKKDEVLPYEDANAQFIRSFTFRSSDSIRYAELYKEITEMKREMTKKESQRREMADLVEQENLIEVKRPAAILSEVTIRPSLEGRKMPGDLQIHQNGFRYSPIRGDQKVDILFSNIKHLFFQPCDNELYVVLHCHLHNPIMVNKKKTKDIQFLREASEAAFDETSNRRRRYQHGDEDELMAEQDERRRRQKLNKEFKAFAEKVHEISGDLEADVPIRELGFNGVPSRSNVFLVPTTECLVHLLEPPFLVVTLAEVEMAYLERVQFHLKNFDIVFVMRDFSRTPVHINSIPMNQLENIKEWLDSVDILFMEGPYNLNWSAIMKNVNEDPAGFYEDGGWANLMADTQGEESEEESASEYEASLASSVEASTDDDDSDADSDADEDADDDDSDASVAAESGSEGESGEDWDELEIKAKRSDERKAAKHRGSDDEGDEDLRPKKKKR